MSPYNKCCDKNEGSWEYRTGACIQTLAIRKASWRGSGILRVRLREKKETLGCLGSGVDRVRVKPGGEGEGCGVACTEVV